MRAQTWVTTLLLVATVAGCGPTTRSAATASEGTAPAPVAQPERSKTITIGGITPITGFEPWASGSTTGGPSTVRELNTTGLISADAHGNFAPRIAGRMASAEDGTLVFLPDGRMQTTLSLRPDVKWHDGAPFTADDAVFGWKVTSHPNVPPIRSPVFRSVDNVAAPDPLTVVITWKAPFSRYRELGHFAFPLLPRHLLGTAFEGDMDSFVNLPYWTSENIHLGPFYLADYGLADSAVFKRFEGYFLGAPKVDTVIFRTVRDPNVLFATLLAGEVDIAAEQALAFEHLMQLRDRWQQDGGGALATREGVWRFASVQFNPEWARPPELSRDVQLRRGLYAALDLPAIREALLPGFSDSEADTFLEKTDSRNAIVGKPFAGARYDVTLSRELLAEGAWRAGADGRLRNPSGEQVAFELRTTGNYRQELSIVAQYWRDLGIDVSENLMGGALVRDDEYRVKFPALELTTQGIGDGTLNRFYGPVIPTPQNRFSGSNSGGYRNPTFDGLFERLYRTLDEREQSQLLKQMGEIIATDLPALSIYKEIRAVAVRAGVRALLGDYAGTGTSGPAIARHAHLWDRD
ncbi:MAG: hypothetical protein HW416_428 [Chloroflexi bacterium]|nr:hypothetical protein [Chloroflexota bacterium]